MTAGKFVGETDSAWPTRARTHDPNVVVHNFDVTVADVHPEFYTCLYLFMPPQAV